MGRVVLERVVKSFGEVEVIPEIDLQIEDGEFIVFVGPSGSGKSTLLRLIAGLEETFRQLRGVRANERSMVSRVTFSR